MKKGIVTTVLLLLTVTAMTAEVGFGKVVRLSFIGDIMVHRANLAMRDYGDIYKGVKDLLSSDDLTVANLESPVDPARPVATYPLFNAPPAYLSAAIASGIQVFSLANNHSFDMGQQGILQTPREIERLGLLRGLRTFWSGTRANLDIRYLPAAIAVGGVKIGFLAVSQFLNLPQGKPYVHVVDYLDQKAVDEFLRWLGPVTAEFDLFILSYHGGEEYTAAASAKKMEFFRKLVENGVSIVFGHHPHVLQEPRIVTVGGSRRLILPSMGNFISGMSALLDPVTGTGEVPGTGDSAIMQVRVLCSRGVASVIGVSAIPITVYRNTAGEMVVGRLAPLAAPDSGLSAAWTGWYRKRLDALTRLLAGEIQVRP